VAVTAGLLAALGVLSRAPIAGEDAGGSALLLTWRVRSEEVGRCRTPTPEELERLPPHMRNPDACVGPVPPYRLTVEVGGDLVIETLVEPSGARGDRPLYVFREIALEPGTYDVRVRFVREDLGEGGADPDPGLASLEFDGPVTLGSGEVRLLTRDGDGGLEVREPVG
jgi:hypothetical protein